MQIPKALHPYQLYIFGWYLLCASIPVSKFFTSVGLWWVVGGWILLWNWREKGWLIRKNWKPLIITTGLFSIFFIGLLYTEDLKYGLKDIRVKLPLLATPILLLTGKNLPKKVVIISLSLLVASAIVASIIGIILFQFNPKTDLRELSPFISHIRLALILSFGAGLCIWGITLWKSIYKWLLILPALWIIFFLNYMENLTGILLIIASFVLLFVGRLYKFNPRVTSIGIAVALLVAIYGAIQVYQISQLIFKTPDSNLDYPSHTILGNAYDQDTRLLTENGHYTWKNLCTKELKQAWNEVSIIPYDTLINGFEFRYTLIRYMTSKGLSKDHEGFKKLSNEDIHAIESGKANVFFLENAGLKSRIFESIYGFKNLIESGYSNGSSEAMRLQYWRIGFRIFKDHPIFGVGTGDIKSAFEKYYDNSNIHLDDRFRKRAHNQFITTFATLGLIGGFLFLFCLTFYFKFYDGPFPFVRKFTWLILIGSMLWEDTLETQAGVTIFALLTSLLFFPGNKRINYNYPSKKNYFI